ncbi:MAG: IS1182 family transposase [Bacillota bacterium]
MTKKTHTKVTFKNYQPNQLQLPTDIELHIPTKHLVRVVNDVIDKMKIEPLLHHYKGGGTSSYHPKMMLKVLVYAYTQKLYSSRQIAKALRENIHFMWLSGNNTPDFRTINRFRSSIMKELIDEVFKNVLELLVEEGLVKFENYFLDGTKIEANANRYTYVWKKNVQRYKAKLQGKINELLIEIEQQNNAENTAYGDRDLEELGEEVTIDSNKLEAKIKELDARLADPKLASKVRKLKKEHLPRLQQYDAQEQLLKERSSFSKTDPDATFMRTKEDHLKTSQLKPCYNVQLGTEDQFIAGYSIHQEASDSVCLISHLEKLERKPENLITDAGYGSQENYEHLIQEEIDIYAKYNTFHQDLKNHRKGSRFQVDDFKYDAEHDEFTCPAGKRLRFLNIDLDQTKTGYEVEYRIYQADDCSDCPLRSQCTRSKGNRKLSVNFRWQELKQLARQNLTSEKGQELRAKRSVDVESVFGRLKQNWSFRRFMLRGLTKVNVELGLLCIAHNLAKKAAISAS